MRQDADATECVLVTTSSNGRPDHWQSASDTSRIVYWPEYLVRLMISIWYCGIANGSCLGTMTLDMPDEGTR